ncbi:MAG: TlpA family protein disulfide reductase [Rikenellaceae bacterium]|nr:TlpA family protein disulfide reductase [Rikenellaceae bacterium]
MDKRHKRRGSTTSLLLTLAVLLIVTLVIIFFPVDAGAKQPVTTATEQQDDIEATTLIHAGDVAPDFTVEMLDGSSVTLSKLQGKPTLLIFWATWCPPCREELSHLQEGVIDVFGDKINVLPISRGEKRSLVEGFLDKMGYTFAVGLDGDQSIYRKYATNYIPRCWVIDSKGEVVYAGVGYDEAIAAEVNEALNKAIK